jgi:23S rRNA (cytosine1962-C5)-methyltransferase
VTETPPEPDPSAPAPAESAPTRSAKAATIYVKGSRLRLGKRRHPWVTPGAIEKTQGSYQDGDVVDVRAAKGGKFLGRGFVNDRSYLRVRLVSFTMQEQVTDALLADRLRAAIALRDGLRLSERTNAYRLTNSEGDGLPGLVVDRYGDVVVVTCGTLGLQQRIEPLLDAVHEATGARAVVEADPPGDAAAKEGLRPARGVVRGALDADVGEVTIDGLKLGVRFQGGQKTGLFLDQRDNVREVAALAKGRRVLDACCYVGTFGLACALAGARETVLFDTSQSAVDEAQANAARNGLEDRVTVRRGSLFRELHALNDAGEPFDLIVLDPPKFVAKRADLQKGRKGYLDANLLALRLLAPGGFLLTCSCSHHMTSELFAGVLREAATRAGADLTFLGERGPGADHPSDLQCPEGRYLKAFLLQRR